MTTDADQTSDTGAGRPPAGVDRVHHAPGCKPDSRRYRTRPGHGHDSNPLIICRRCGARAAVPDAGPARPSRGSVVAPTDDGPAADVVVARTDAWPRPAVARTNLAVRRYFCRQHEDREVNWRGTDCPLCADERDYPRNQEEEFPQ